MADLIPPLSSCLSRMQTGEKRFARRLGSHLEDDYLCWYDIPVGHRRRYTDFVILHALRGLLLLEVKDWKRDTIQRATPTSFELLTNRGLVTVANPIEQARQCAHQLVGQLQRDPQLIQKDGKHKGQLVMPYGYGVVLTSLTRAQFEECQLGEVIPETRTICKDEMLEATSIEEFQERLWNMFDYQFHNTLTQPQIDRVRWHMFPEIRMQAQPQLALPDTNIDELFEIPDLIKVMDLKQEKLARGLGSGHRVIHGVAGSGKTMILGYRCLHLAKLESRPVLALCYNVTLAAHLRALIAEKGVSDRVNVYNFHAWCSTVLKSYNFKPPAPVNGNFDGSIELLIEQVKKGQIPKGQYGAILIDEGHDFKKEWLQLVVDMVDPDTNSLLLLYDDAQSIYNRSGSLGFPLKEAGIEAQGRTTVLKLNYRNTEQILKFAFDFIDDYVEPTEISDDKVPVVAPDSSGRKGPLPVVKDFKTFDDEARYVTSIFKKLQRERNIPWSEMCVLYCHNWMGQAVANAMRDAGVPFTWLKDSAARREFSMGEETVKVVTMHSSKGLEFPTVATCGVGSLGKDEERIESDAKLLYVAMTRATENLLITGSKGSGFTPKLGAMAEKHGA